MNALQVSNLATVAVSIDPAVYSRKVEALAIAREITAVSSDFQQTEAVEALRTLKALQKETEASRKAVKAPVLELGKKIDAVASTFLAEIDTESNRLTFLVTAWETAQRQKAQEAERLRLEEERRIREAEEERLLQTRREEEEARRAEQNARNEQERLAAEQRRRDAEAEAMRQRDEAAIRKAAAPVTIAAPKTAGTVLREQWTFEVLDVRALLDAAPDLVELTPRRAAILERIRAGARDIPGLRIYQDTKVGVRV